MFYSTDILTKRKTGGLAVVWLAATLGSKGSTFKKISRKEIVGMNLVSVCEQLASPEEPFALRLSSNLLCGIARVYQQQYVTYQADVTQVHQSLKKAFNDAFKNPTNAVSVDLAPAPTQGPAATTAAQGINLAIDPALAVLGWDPNWDVGINWAEVMQGGSGYGGGEGEVEFGSGVEREGTPDSGRVRHQPSDKHKVKDLASITLHEPHIDDYLLRDNDDPSMRLDDGLGGEAYIIGEDEPGLLEGMSPELDALLQVGSQGLARSRAGSGGSGARYGASSSAQGGDVEGLYGEDLGGMDYLDAGPRQEDGANGFDLDPELRALGDETYEERVRREHDEAAAQRSGLAAGPRPSSIGDIRDQQDTDRSPSGVTASSSNKRKSAAADDADFALPSPRKPKKSPKKLKHITIDSEISLTDEQVKEARASYPSRMERERARAAKAQQDKEGGTRAVDLLFAAPEGFGGALANFWKSTVSDQLVRPGENRAAAEKKRKTVDKDDQAAKRRKSDEGDVELGRSKEFGRFGEPGAEDWDLGADFAAAKEYDVPLNDQDFGGMEMEFQDMEEYGRAASQGALTGSGKENFPWNEEVVTSDAGAGFVAGASSQGGTARISQDTPLKAGEKRRSRTGSLVPSALGSGRAGSEGLVGGDFEEFQIDEEGLVSQEASQPNAEVLAVKLEHDSLKFLSFANRKALAQPDEELLFSDIVPVASTSNAAAAAAFYHLLALATRSDVKVEQGEPYGEIAVEIKVEV